MKRYLRLHRPHYKETLKLGLPVIVSQLGQITVGLADNMMIGQIGITELAAASFANTLFSLPLILAMGFAMSLTPLVGRAWANHDEKAVKSLWKNGLVSNSLMAAALLLFAFLLYVTMPLMHQPEHLIPISRQYFVYIAASLLPLMVFLTGKQLFEGLSNTRTAMMIILSGNVMNIAGNYIFIYGKLGMPEMGLNGAGFSTLLARVFMALAMILIVQKHRIIQSKYKQRISATWQQVKTIYKLGIPMGIHLFSEASAFIVAGIMMGWLGETGLAAHQIVISLSTLGFMLYQGIGVSTTIRISQLLVKGNHLLLRRASVASTQIVSIMVLIISCFFLLFSPVLPYLFTSNREVASLATNLMIVLVIFQLFDGIQIIFAGILRGMSDAKVPSMLTLFSYFGIAIPVSYLAAFKTGLGPLGIWIGFPVGLGVCATLFYFRIKKMIAGYSGTSPALIPASK